MSCTIQKKTGVTTQGCKGDCEKTWKEIYPEILIYKNHGPYAKGFKMCKVCDIAPQTDLVRCLCCKQVLRSRKRS